MPGYLTNRFITLNPSSELAAVESALDSRLDTAELDITSLETRVTEAEANIDDLSLNLGV